MRAPLQLVMDAVLSPKDLSGVLLVKDCMEAHGGFLLLQALKLALSQSCKVLLLSVAQGAAHYQQLLRKHGINMAAALEARQLVLLDALHTLSQLPAGSGSSGLSLEGVFAQIAAHSVGRSGERLCLLIDDLSLLAAVADCPMQLPAFLHSCCSLGAAAQGFIFVALVHWDIGADEPWVAGLEHAAQVVLDVEPLASGQSTEVTGRVELHRRQVPSYLTGCEVPPLGIQAYYYKLSDGAAAFFPL